MGFLTKTATLLLVSHLFIYSSFSYDLSLSDKKNADLVVSKIERFISAKGNRYRSILTDKINALSYQKNDILKAYLNYIVLSIQANKNNTKTNGYSNCTQTGLVLKGETAYRGCDTADIIICTGNGSGHTISACNVGSHIAGTGELSYGNYYQWGRNENATGAFIRSTYTGALTNGNIGNSNFYQGDATFGDWWQKESGNDKNTARWVGVAPQGPCANGYHIPSEPEWFSVLQVLGWFDYNQGNKIDPLSLPFNGNRSGKDGIYYEKGMGGYYWSSSTAGFTSTPLIVGNDGGSLLSSFFQRSDGMAIRCFKN